MEVFYIWSAPFGSPHSQKLSLTLSWFRVLLFMVFLVSFEGYPQSWYKNRLSFASFVLHLAEISISEAAAPPFLHSRPGSGHLCTFWHHPDTGNCVVFRIPSGSLSRPCCIMPVKVSGLYFFLVCTNKISSKPKHCCIFSMIHTGWGGKSFSWEPTTHLTIIFSNYCKIFYSNGQLMGGP